LAASVAAAIAGRAWPMSQIQLVYGSLTTAIAVLLSLEIGALVLLIGAQVIAEYERISREPIETPSRPVKLEEP
jgi:membrane protein